METARRHVARARRAGPCRVVMVNVSDAGRQVVGAYAHRAGWLVTAAPWMGEGPARMARRWDARAFLISPHGNIAPALRRKWARTRLPVVEVPWAEPGVLGVPYVRMDCASMGRAAAEHLLQNGFRRLAYAWLGPMPSLDEQMAGFRQAARRAGATFHCLDYPARGRPFGWDAARFRRWLAAEIRPLPKPLGVFLDSDWTALEAVQACGEAGLAVPEEVAIVGCYNNVAICENAPLAISSVEAIGDQFQEACRMLERMIRGAPRPSRPVVLRARRVVVRPSSDSLAAEHPEVAKALRYIRVHFANPRLGVEDVVAATGMCKRGLAAAFRRTLGTTVAACVRNMRVNRAMELLAAGEMKIPALAAACGFRDGEHLWATLVRRTGLGPRAWRKKLRRD